MNKLNNKGFAITTILFGTMLLFMLLLAALLSILSVYRKNMELLTDDVNGIRSKIEMKAKPYSDANKIRGLYCSGGTCRYYKSSELAMQPM